MRRGCLDSATMPVQKPTYAELHCATNFSFLTGASHPEELVDRAAELGYAALAVTDECSLAGVVRAHVQAKERGLHLIIGSAVQLTTFKGEQHAKLVLLAQTRRGYGNLSEFITLARRRAEKGRYTAYVSDLQGKAPTAPHLAGLPECLALLIPSSEQSFESLFAQAMWLKTWFAGRAWIALELLHRAGDAQLLEKLTRLSDLTALPLVAAGDVLMHTRSRKILQDTLTAIRLNKPVHACGFELQGNAEQYLRSWEQLGEIYCRAFNAEARSLRSEAKGVFDPALECRDAPFQRVEPDDFDSHIRRKALDPGLRRDDSINVFNRQVITEAKNASPHVPCASSGIFASKGAPDKRQGISHPALSDRQSEDAATAANGLSRKKLPALATLSASALNAFCLDSTRHLQVLNETLKIASLCTFSLDELRYEYPEEIVPKDQTPATWLRTLVYQGAHTERYPQGIPPKIQTQIEYELALIADLQYEPYFLTVADIVQWARSQGILCQGRGSAANSVVCYCLAITEVDPARMSMLFERFISKERNEPPDIDVDFEHQRREEVIQYIYKKYGRHRAALTATVVSYRPRSAVRDVGKALDIDLDRIDRLSKSQHWFDGRRVSEERLVENGFDPASPVVQHWMRLTQELMGFPRHLSQHTGGFVIARDDLSRLVPIENAAMPDRCVIEWDKDDLDAVGLLKVDVLALGMLSAIRRALEFVWMKREFVHAKNEREGAKDAKGREEGQSLSVESRVDKTLSADKPSRTFASLAPSRLLPQKQTGLPRLKIQDIPAEDKKTYDMICAADTVGVFQIESRAQMSMLPRLKPRKFYDLVIEVAIVRPGPIQGGMVHPYLKRRNGEEEPDYPSDEVRPALERTLGVPIFQEQVMQVAILAADFTPGEADKLRRAMAAWKRKGGLGPFYERLTSRMVAKGYPQEFADRIFKQIEGFGEYGFPESHAASFALLVYVSCWLKCHHPDAFLAALLNSQPMGFYAPAQLVRDAREHGVTVLPVDVMVSGVEASLEIELDPGLRRDDSISVLNHQAIAEGKIASPHVPCASSGIFASKGAPDKRQGITEEHFHSKPFGLSLSKHPVRLGLNQVAGLSTDAAERIVQARAGKPFASIEDLTRRAALSAHELQALAAADALSKLSGNRHQAAWDVAGIDTRLTPLLKQTSTHEAPIALAAPTQGQDVVADYKSIGLSLKNHPLALLRERLKPFSIQPANILRTFPHGRLARASGLVTHRQRPETAKGTVFVTLEDETGQINVIVWPAVVDAQRVPLLSSTLLTVYGTWQKQNGVTHLLATKLVDHSHLLGELLAGQDTAPIPVRSRNFR